MSDDVKHSLIWSTALIIIFISVPWSISNYYKNVAKSAIEAGLEQSTLPGQSGVYWAKRVNK
jgi:hypothetical protein